MEETAMNSLIGKTALVVGASRGLGRGIAQAFGASGASVIAVARDATALRELAASGPSITPEIAAATDPATADSLLARYTPDILALVAGAQPTRPPLHEQTRRTFDLTHPTPVH